MDTGGRLRPEKCGHSHLVANPRQTGLVEGNVTLEAAPILNERHFAFQRKSEVGQSLPLDAHNERNLVECRTTCLGRRSDLGHERSVKARLESVYGWDPGRGLSDDDGVAVLVHGNPVADVGASAAEVAGIDQRRRPSRGPGVQLHHKGVVGTVNRSVVR